MKSLKSFILPAALVLISAGSAFATSKSKSSNAAIVNGHVFRPGEEQPCENTGIQCSTEGNVICTADVGMGTENLKELVGSACPNNLYFPQ